LQWTYQLLIFFRSVKRGDKNRRLEMAAWWTSL